MARENTTPTAAEPLPSCLRCGAEWQRLIVGPATRPGRRSQTDGFCANCMVTHFLLSVEVLDCSLANLRYCAAGVMNYTPLRQREIDWIEVISHWELPWPSGREPQPYF